MSAAATMKTTVSNQAAKPWTWWQTAIVAVAILLGTASCIRAVHKPQPIKEAVASLVKMVPFLAPLFAPLLLDDGLPEPSHAVFSSGCECPVEIKPDGSATASINGESVPALNHEFGS